MKIAKAWTITSKDFQGMMSKGKGRLEYFQLEYENVRLIHESWLSWLWVRYFNNLGRTEGGRQLF